MKLKVIWFIVLATLTGCSTDPNPEASVHIYSLQTSQQSYLDTFTKDFVRHIEAQGFRFQGTKTEQWMTIDTFRQQDHLEIQVEHLDRTVRFF